MQVIFKNAQLFDIETGWLDYADILTDDDKIAKVGKVGSLSANCEVVDLHGDIVMPNFVNAFCSSKRAFEMDYGEFDQSDVKLCKDIENLMTIKNLLAGAICNDVSANEKEYLLENVDHLEENELSFISEKVAKDKLRLFVKAGQDLDELGMVDKLYKKPMVQVLEDFGFLDRKPIFVGGNCLEKDDLELLSNYDCDFCLTVGEDGKNGRRPTNLLSLKSFDFNVGLGSGYSFEIDFFAFMRQILMSQRGLFEGKNCISEKEVLSMACNAGAKMLFGEENPIKEGKKANFMVIKNAKSLYDDIFKTLVWEKSKRDVVMTVLNGKILQKNGQILMKNCGNYDTIIMDIQEKLRRK